MVIDPDRTAQARRDGHLPEQGRAGGTTKRSKGEVGDGSAQVVGYGHLEEPRRQARSGRQVVQVIVPTTSARSITHNTEIAITSAGLCIFKGRLDGMYTATVSSCSPWSYTPRNAMASLVMARRAPGRRRRRSPSRRAPRDSQCCSPGSPGQSRPV